VEEDFKSNPVREEKNLFKNLKGEKAEHGKTRSLLSSLKEEQAVGR